jgi:D-glutamate cyclase
MGSMLTDYMPVADAIERLITMEIRRPFFQGVVSPLAEVAREKQGGRPPILIAAEHLKETVKPGDVVVIATGLMVPDVMPFGESDGPLGAAALAYALRHGLGAVPLVIAEPECLPPTRAALHAVGLVERSIDYAREINSSCMMGTFPCDNRPDAEQAEAAAERMLAELKPRAIIVIEKLGLNEKGIAHRAGGKACMDGRMRIEVLTEKARAAGITTIAIGDLGNEAGTGLLADACRENWRFGARCQCPCGAGIAVTEISDITIMAQVSNWGGYGVAALLGIMLNNEDVLHSVEAERLMLDDCTRAGAVDGITVGHDFSVDGVPGRIHCHLIDTLHVIMHTSLAYP